MVLWRATPVSSRYQRYWWQPLSHPSETSATLWLCAVIKRVLIHVCGGTLQPPPTPTISLTLWQDVISVHDWCLLNLYSCRLCICEDKPDVNNAKSNSLHIMPLHASPHHNAYWESWAIQSPFQRSFPPQPWQTTALFMFSFFFSTYRLFTYNTPGKEFGANDNLKVRDDEWISVSCLCVNVYECVRNANSHRRLLTSRQLGVRPVSSALKVVSCQSGLLFGDFVLVTWFETRTKLAAMFLKCRYNKIAKWLTEFPLSWCYVTNKRVCSSRVKPCEDARRQMLRNIGRFIFH